ncbi:MAG: hypothetical protein K2Y32_03020 [Candidatus Obscuribacterales bacterium]|nr:hypothetical protein [Candidatus Obscuribacterales bacterium]
MVEVDPASRERLELETRVLAAALRQSLQLGDMEGSNLAHEQIFILLKARQELMNGPSAAELSRALRASEAGLGNANGQALQEKTRRIPDIEWFEESSEKAQKPGSEVQVSSSIENGQENISLPEAETDKPQVAALGVDEEKAVSKEPAEPDFYQFFGLEQGADRQDIHRVFLVRVRAILRGIKQRSEPLRGFERQEVLKGLQKVWINHDILQDASTRGDYDQRLSGHAVSDEAPQEVKTGAAMRIGELLQSSGLLEKTELEIAADMHKAMPELMFGSFLVKQGFVQERDLECVLISQQLIKTGQISLEQFQELMPERGDTGTMFNLLLERGLVTREELDQAIASLPTEEAGIVARALAQETRASMAEATEATEATEAKEVPEVPEVPEVTAEPDVPVKLTPNNAVPSWKDQLDWSEPESESESEPESESQSESGSESKSQSDVAVANSLAAKPEGELLSFSPDEGATDIHRDAELIGAGSALEGAEQASSNLGQVPGASIDLRPESELEPESKTDKEPGQRTQERVRKRSLIDLMFDLNPQESLKETLKESNSENSLKNSEPSQSSAPLADGATEAVTSHLSEPSNKTDLDLESSDGSAAAGSKDVEGENEVPLLEGQVESSPGSLDLSYKGGQKEGKRPSLDDVLFGGSFRTDKNKADASTEAESISSSADIADLESTPAVDSIVQEYPQEGLQDNTPERAKETLASATREVNDEIEHSDKSQHGSGSDSSSLDLPELEPEMDIEKELNDLERLEALDNLDDDGDDLESDTSTELPALENVDKGKAAAKDNWSIVSKPASYLASFLMDEMPARKDKGNTGNTGKKDDDGGRRGFKRKKRN